MKILHIIGAYKPAYIYGGPMFSVSALAETQAKMGLDVHLFSTNSNGSQNLNVPLNILLDVEGVKVTYFKRLALKTEFSMPLIIKLLKTYREFDIIHIHSFWSLNVLFIIQILNINKKKFIISPRGMLSSYSFGNKFKFIKKFIFNVLSKNIIQKNVVHVTSNLEQQEIELLFENKITIFNLPNILNFSNLRFKPNGTIKEHTNNLSILFLSRIDKKKGLELLISALPSLIENNIIPKLKIAGTGDIKYINELKEYANTLGVSNYTEWLGHIDAVEKSNTIEWAQLVVLPSYNENFANVILESLFMGKPVIVSNKVGLFDYVQFNSFGWVIENNKEDIVSSCLDYISSEQIWIDRKEEMHKQISKDFSPQLVTENYLSKYNYYLQ